MVDPYVFVAINILNLGFSQLQQVLLAPLQKNCHHQDGPSIAVYKSKTGYLGYIDGWIGVDNL